MNKELGTAIVLKNKQIKNVKQAFIKYFLNFLNGVILDISGLSVQYTNRHKQPLVWDNNIQSNIFIALPSKRELFFQRTNGFSKYFNSNKNKLEGNI